MPMVVMAVSVVLPIHVSSLVPLLHKGYIDVTAKKHTHCIICLRLVMKCGG